AVAALPQRLSVNYAEIYRAPLPSPIPTQSSLTRIVTYAASAPIPKPPSGPSVTVDYTDRTNGALTMEALARASQIPTGMTATATSFGTGGLRKGSFNATGGVLGSVEGGFANGAVVLDPLAGNPYLNLTDRGANQSITGRIDSLQSAS